MRYREISPRKSLARFIECFWVLDSEGSPAPGQPERILPDGCVELILNLKAPFRELKQGGETHVQPLRFLAGQLTRPILIAPTGAVELIGIRFQPGGTLPFFRFPMHEVNNQVVELTAISHRLERELDTIVAGDQPIDAKVVALEDLLWKRVRDVDEPGLVDLAAEIVNRGGNISIDALSENAGISARQLQRRFLNEVGIGPKLFCRILRFQQVFRAIDGDDPKWAEVAVDCGYYDQAHLIRDFQQFGSQTPSVLMAQSTPLTEAFKRKHRMSDFSNTPRPA